MAVGHFPAVGGSKCNEPTASGPNLQCPPLTLAPQTALFAAIDLHCCLQEMEARRRSPLPADDLVTYYVNRDSAGWVEQRVRRRVYIELKLECTRNRSRDGHKSRDDWLCVYCKGSFPSKLRLTDHRVAGCPRGPVDETGSKCELPVYPNLKTAKQGKDLKLALQRADVWDSLQHNSIWRDLNPELTDITCPPLGARVQRRQFLQPTLEDLVPCPAPVGDSQPQGKPRPQRAPRQHTAPSSAAAYVDLEEDGDDEREAQPSRPNKRSHAQMADGHRPCHSARQFNTAHTKQPQHVRGDRQSAHPPRSSRPKTTGDDSRQPPPQPILVTPIQTRSPSPDRAIILPPSTPAPHAQGHPPMAPASPMQTSTASQAPHAPGHPPMAPVSPMQTSTASQYVASGLRKDRQAFYVKAASAARSGVKMDYPKPALRPPIQPPGLYHLMACGLFNFDLEGGDFHAFEEEVEKWQQDPSFLDRLWAAYGRFHGPCHQVHLAH